MHPDEAELEREKRNLAERHADVAARLREMMSRFDKELKSRTRPPGRA